MKSYSTISIVPETKRKIKLLKGSETYSEFLDDLVEELWEESEYDKDDLEEVEV